MPKIKIKIKPEIIKAGGGFHDFYSHADIRAKKPDDVLEVENTPFIQRKLDTGELILVTNKKEESKSEDKTK